MRTFNNGIGMILVVAPEDVAQVEDYLQEQKEEKMYRLGRLYDRKADAEFLAKEVDGKVTTDTGLVKVIGTLQ